MNTQTQWCCPLRRSPHTPAPAPRSRVSPHQLSPPRSRLHTLLRCFSIRLGPHCTIRSGRRIFSVRSIVTVRGERGRSAELGKEHQQHGRPRRGATRDATLARAVARLLSPPLSRAARARAGAHRSRAADLRLWATCAASPRASRGRPASLLPAISFSTGTHSATTPCLEPHGFLYSGHVLVLVQSRAQR